MPAVQSANIMVGPANLYISAADAKNTSLPAFTAGTSVLSSLDASAAWRYVGATRDGVEVSYEPTVSEVEVDQLKDAALMFNSDIKVMVRTSLVEATLTNLLLTWGLASTQLSAGVMAIGNPTDNATERTITIVGKSPRTIPANPSERIYFARRVISMDTVAHSLRRTEATLFPVVFRLLPEPTYSGSEYGTVTDRSL